MPDESLRIGHHGHSGVLEPAAVEAFVDPTEQPRLLVD